MTRNQKNTERLQKKWETWGEGFRLVILDSPYRVFVEPLLEYIEKIDAKRQPNEIITIVVPQFVPVPIKPPEPPKPPKPPKWPAAMVLKAQGLYPEEAAEKAARMDQAKAPPAPTGAWGKPQ